MSKLPRVLVTGSKSRVVQVKEPLVDDKGKWEQWGSCFVVEWLRTDSMGAPVWERVWGGIGSVDGDGKEHVAVWVFESVLVALVGDLEAKLAVPAAPVAE